MRAMRLGLYGFGAAFMEVAAEVAIRTSVRSYPLAKANAALTDLRNGAFDGAAVLEVR